MEYLSYIILGIMFGIITIIIIQVKKYYYKISEKELAEKMEKRLHNVKNNVDSENVLQMKKDMKTLDTNSPTKIVQTQDTSSLIPTNIVSQINEAIGSGVSKISDLYMDVYDEYMKPVIYKTQKMVM
jgi:flagellar biosynthesis protein FliP